VSPISGGTIGYAQSSDGATHKGFGSRDRDARFIQPVAEIKKNF